MDTAAAAAKAKKKKNSYWVGVWTRLKRNKLAVAGLIVLILLVIIGIIAPLITPYDYAEQNYDDAMQFPNGKHWFGTDNFGRDIFSRVLYGTRYTLIIGFGCIAAAALVGVTLGAMAGFYPKSDNLIMRFIDIIMGIPTFMLAISIITALGASMETMMIALAITSMPSFARVTRAQVLTIRGQEYVEAARSIGASNLRILLRHILPNSLAPILVQFTLGVVNVILWSASLSFIGMGVQPPTPEWGLLISAGRTYLREYWYMSIIPGLAIILSTYALNLLGDGLRDALDPKLKQ